MLVHGPQQTTDRPIVAQSGARFGGLGKRRVDTLVAATKLKTTAGIKAKPSHLMLIQYAELTF